MLIGLHQGSHSLAGNYPIDVALGVHVEDDDRHVVVHAQRQRGRVHHLQAALERLAVRDLGEELGVAVLLRIGGVDALDAVLGHQDDLGVDLVRAQRGRGVGGEERVAGAGREDHDAVLLEVAHRAAADVGLGDLGDGDRRLHARVDALVLERVLQRQRVEHGGEHAHVVGGGALHARGGAGQAAVDVAGADHDRDLDAAVVDLADLARDRRDALEVGAVGEVAHERLPRQLQQDSPEGGRAHAPTTNFEKRRMTTFSPVCPESSARICSIVLPSCLSPLTCGWWSRTTSSIHLRSLPSAILARDVLGLVGRLLLEHAQLGLLGLLGDLVLGDVAHLRRGGDVQRDVAGERDEVLVAGDEVGVAVDLDEHAGLAVGVDVGLDRALGGLAAAHLERLVAEADAQQLDGGVDVAAGLGQRRLAVHHARAGLVAQLLDLRRGDRGSAHAFSWVFSSVLLRAWLAGRLLLGGRRAGGGVGRGSALALGGAGLLWHPVAGVALAALLLLARAGARARGGLAGSSAAWAAAPASAAAVPSGCGGAAWAASATSASAAWRSPPPVAVVLAASAAWRSPPVAVGLAASAGAASAGAGRARPPRPRRRHARPGARRPPRPPCAGAPPPRGRRAPRPPCGPAPRPPCGPAPPRRGTSGSPARRRRRSPA